MGLPERDWTVLLLRPDYAAEDFGHNTLTLHVKAVTEGRAVEAARKRARELDGTDEPVDYYCLFCARGAVCNLAYDGEVVGGD
jgi:hypothetical protein